jgi:hypothetical protein
MQAMPEARPLHLHTVETLCTDLICGQSIAVGSSGELYALADKPSRSILNWYRQNRNKWAKNVAAADIETIINTTATEPPKLAGIVALRSDKKKNLTLVKIEAHRFGGLSAYSDAGEAPDNFVLEITKPIMLLEGWNGSGKTSIVNAAIWCLTGQLLRPQRKPEQAISEFECRIEGDSDSDASFHKLTPVTPLPDSRYPLNERIPIDTWVELTLVDETGTTLAPVRRTQSRTSRGVVTETLVGFNELGVDPIAGRIGTVIPGLLPFIQIGSVSEFGRAIADLTGLSDLVDLARHATKVEQRIDGDLRKVREQEIQSQNDAFRQATNDLQNLIDENPSLAPSAPLPSPESGSSLEEKLVALQEHFVSCKTKVFNDAKLVLGDHFDPAIKSARDDLEASVGPALSQLGQISKLPSMARLGALSKLTDDEIAVANQALAKIFDEAAILQELTENPAVGRRKQLYARVSAWMNEHDYPLEASCAVCGADLDHSIDSETHQPVRSELRDAAKGNTELLSHTIHSWAKARIGNLSNVLPEALASELRRDLPLAPTDLIKIALDTELFETDPFKETLGVLREASRGLSISTLDALPPFSGKMKQALPVSGEGTADLDVAILRVTTAIEFARWQHSHREAINAAILRIVTKKNPCAEPLSNDSPLGVKLVALSDVVTNAAPANTAIGYCERITKAFNNRRGTEARIQAYNATINALKPIIALGELAQKQVEDLRTILQGRAEHWRSRFYNNAYETSGLSLVRTDMDSRGLLSIFVGSKGISAPAQHVSNASALRASLVGFFFAFWEHVFALRGGFTLLILDDPQELLDDDNRDRLARTLPELVKVGAHVLVTTHSRDFARMSVEEGRKTQSIEHRSVHPVNASRSTAETAGAIEEFDRKRAEFLSHVDDAIKAQEYAVEARSFIEARLADLFDNPAYPAYSAPSKVPGFSSLIGRLRGLAGNPPNELFRKKVISDFCNDRALAEGSLCLALLNKSHHKDKSRISYKDVKDQDESLRRLRNLIDDIHEEFRRWKWRDAAPSDSKVAQLQSMAKQTFRVLIHPDLAAFTSAPIEASPQDVSVEEFDGQWFEDKSLFFLRNDNLGFAAPAGSIAVVESESRLGNDRNLIIARHEGRTLARRLLRPDRSASAIALAAQTPDPRKSPPTVLADPAEVQIHRIVGVLFDDIVPPTSKQEAVAVSNAPVLANLETAYRVRDDSALPLALPGQIVLGGPRILPNELDSNIGGLVALTLVDGTSIFKRVGAKLPGAMGVLRQFESIGGLGSSEIIATEEMEEPFGGIPLMAFARIVLGVIYEK